jgi:hypothetical protein
MSLDIGILFAEHMYLLGANPLGLQLLLNGFKIVEIVTGVIVPIHDVPPISLGGLAATTPYCHYLLTVTGGALPI